MATGASREFRNGQRELMHVSRCGARVLGSQADKHHRRTLRKVVSLRSLPNYGRFDRSGICWTPGANLFKQDLLFQAPLVWRHVNFHWRTKTIAFPPDADIRVAYEYRGDECHVSLSGRI